MSYQPEILAAFLIFGFSKPVDWDQIKKAYHTLVIQHHPDKGGTSAKFRQLQEAYGLLQCHLDPGQTTTKTDHSIPSFVYNRDPKCNDIHITLDLSLEDIFSGQLVSTLIDYDQICPICQGKGYPPNIKPNPCPSCQGPNCQLCEGTGLLLNQHQRCHRCAGIKIIKARKKLNVQVPAGVQQNDRIQLRNQGNQYPQKQTGHILIIIKEKKHSVYQRRGADLFLIRTVNLSDALAGFTLTLPSLDQQHSAQILQLQTKTPVIPGQVRKIPNLGMPMRTHPHKRGSLCIQFQVRFPNQLVSKEEQTKLGQLLKQPITPFIDEPILF